MKNYLAFYGKTYYPCGGMDDFIGSYDNTKEAIEAIHIQRDIYSPDDVSWEFCWGSVWSIKEHKAVCDIGTK